MISVVRVFRAAIPIAILVLLFASSARTQTTRLISYGDCVDSTIATAGQINQYRFVGDSNDVIIVRMVASWINGPRIDVFDPLGNLLVSKSGSPNWNSTRIDTLRLIRAGTHTINARDVALQTGTYGLSLQRTKNPGLGRAISYGQTIRDSIRVRSCIKAYTFGGLTGEIVIVRLDANWLNGPQLELYDQAGRRIFAVAGSPNWNSIRIDTLTLSSSGSFTLLAIDASGQGTGNYDLYIQRTFTPGNARVTFYPGMRLTRVPTDFTSV